MRSHSRTGNRILAIIVMMTVMMSLFAIADTLPAYAATVKIGQACSGDGGKLRGGIAGDQSGGEVCACKWGYSSSKGSSYHWVYVIRAKDSKVASKLNKAMKAACSNNHIGYDQQYPDRCSLYDEAKANKWDIYSISKNCETTCASVVSVCCNAAGISAPRYWDSSLVYKDLKATGKFTIYTGAKYTQSSDLLKAGDILVSPGKHTAMVISGTMPATIAAAKTVTSPFIAGKDYVTKRELKIRKGASTSYEAKTMDEITEGAQACSYEKDGVAILKKGTVVTCIKTSGNWINIPSGWICGKYNSTFYLEEYKEPPEEETTETDKQDSDKKDDAAKAETEKSETAQKSETATKTVTSPFKKGKEYKLQYNMKVRKGAGTKYAVKKKSGYSDSAKKYCVLIDGVAYLKKGTIVTCLETSGNWIRIPSGWICGKSGSTLRLKAYTPTKTTATRLVIKAGKDYKLAVNLNVRTGPGENYKIKKRSSLSASARKYCVTGCTNAILKKGTVVTCLKVKGDWMKIPSGWISCKSGYIKKA